MSVIEFLVEGLPVAELPDAELIILSLHYQLVTGRQRMRADGVLDDGLYNVMLSGEIKGCILG